MKRPLLVLLGVATCSAAPGPGNDIEVRGALLREGKPLDFATAPLRTAGTRCREATLKAVAISLRLPPEASPFKIEDTVLEVSGTPGLTPLDRKLEPQTADRTFDPERDRWGRVLAWIGPANRVTQATLPDRGWVRFKALAKEGPIDVELELDFGKLGKVAGRARVAKTDEKVCVSPAPPPPGR